MSELQFDVEVFWAGRGREGAGRVVTDDLEFDYSAPGAMGVRDTRQQPGRAPCLRRRDLLGNPVRSAAPRTTARHRRSHRGTRDGNRLPRRGKFERLTVSPTIVGGDPTRSDEYDLAAEKAHARCFIG
jgi:organic hydroperoxide reductase OsmC/OhrA